MNSEKAPKCKLYYNLMSLDKTLYLVLG